MNEVDDFIERQQEVDKLLTSDIIRHILSENWSSINTVLSKDKDKKFITIVYSSIQALLRKITGKQDEKPVHIAFSSIDEILQLVTNNTLLTCKSLPSSICVCIGTYLPTSVITGENDSIYTHTYTCINNMLN